MQRLLWEKWNRLSAIFDCSRKSLYSPDGRPLEIAVGWESGLEVVIKAKIGELEFPVWDSNQHYEWVWTFS